MSPLAGVAFSISALSEAERSLHVSRALAERKRHARLEPSTVIVIVQLSPPPLFRLLTAKGSTADSSRSQGFHCQGFHCQGLHCQGLHC